MSVFQPLFDLPPVFQEISWSPFQNAGMTMIVLREDLRHPTLGGNKLWKLKYNVEEFSHSGAAAIASFGGAYSNHLAALSEACFQAGIPFHAFVRGEEQPVNDRIRRMENQGTKVHYISREQYRQKEEAGFLEKLLISSGWSDAQISSLYVIPEGGNNEAGRAGCKELGKLIPADVDYAICACGTGGTLAGMLHSLSSATKGIGIAVVQSGNALHNMMIAEGLADNKFEIIQGYEEGGYGKNSIRLEQFMQEFKAATSLPLEHVYTGKLFFAIDDLARKDFFHRGAKVVIVHTGGVF
ncbi:MAG: hypothetical protein RIQ47_1590 [Bacteroidota bacterium]|jgi:1-aminocyclopropane-1-carboxylate deaminase